MCFRVFILLVLLSAKADARVFRFGSEVFAGYFNGSIAMSSLGDDAYANSSGSQTVFSEEPDFNYAGELGILFNSQAFTFLLGVEFISPEKMEVVGNSSSGTKFLDLESKIRATVLKAGLQFSIVSSDRYRTFLGFGGGIANVSTDNAYTLTNDGQSTYSLPAAYTESAEASTSMFHIDFGLEYNFADTSTLILFGGYRYFPVDEWEYSEAGTGFTGTYAKGATVVNHDGSKRSTDLSGVYTGIGFRIYID